jgi:uncharacterized protein YyaL (SSP411 family)
VSGPLEIAVVGEEGDVLRGELERAARLSVSPGAMVVAGAPGASGVPLLADRGLVDGKAAAYVCRGMVCERPVTDVDELRKLLGG